MTLGTIIVTHNSAAWVEKAVRSLFGSKGHFEHRLVVVDNGSRDKTLAVLARIKKSFDFEIIKNENTGFSGGVNVGLRALGFKNVSGFRFQVSGTAPEVVLLLNPDAQLAPDALSILVSRLRGPVGIVAPKMVYPDGQPQSSNFGVFPNWRTQLARRLKLHKIKPWGHFVLPQTVGAEYFIKERAVPWVSGGAMLLSREAISRVGFWDTNYFLYVEDVDYCRRARLKGFDVRYVPSAVVYHKLGHSTMAGEILNYKFQITNEFQTSDANTAGRVLNFGFRILRFVWDLVLGIWNFRMFTGEKTARDWEHESLQYYFRKYAGKKARVYYMATDLHREPAGLRRLDFIIEVLQKEFGRINDLRILDVGAGHGSITGALADLGAQVTAVEKDQASLVTLKSRSQELGFRVIETDLKKIKPGQKFDAIIATEILEHFRNPEAVARQLGVNLKRNGVMIVSVPNGAGLEEKLRRFGLRSRLGRFLKRIFRGRVLELSAVQSAALSLHQVFYTLTDWQKVWSKAGFSVKRVASQSAGFKTFFYVLGRLFMKRDSAWFRRLDRWDARLADMTPPRYGDGFLFVLKSNSSGI